MGSPKMHNRLIVIVKLLLLLRLFLFVLSMAIIFRWTYSIGKIIISAFMHKLWLIVVWRICFHESFFSLGILLWHLFRTRLQRIQIKFGNKRWITIFSIMSFKLITDGHIADLLVLSHIILTQLITCVILLRILIKLNFKQKIYCSF